jgi:membrane-bound metal-dependent hydrolase YbcI (DUF457 family)
MTPIGHLAIGFALKPAGTKIPLGVLLAASWLLDLLYFLFAFLGLESVANLTNPGAVPSPYSHSLFMALIWTALAGLLAWRIYHSRRAGLVIGLVVFSHWVLDFVSWNNLFLFFKGSPQVGLDLFNALGEGTIYIEISLFLAGMAIYLATRKRTAAKKDVQNWPHN